ncbi:MAG: hypothetical protein ACJ70V_00275, partial [Nitrososphaera sp.]
MVAQSVVFSRNSTIVIIIVGLLSITIPHVYAQQVGITVKEWEVPTPNSGPHDVVVNPEDGAVWFTEINANKIGKFEPAT